MFRIDPARLQRSADTGLVLGGYGSVWFGTLDEGHPTARRVAVKELRQVGTDGERARVAFVSDRWTSTLGTTG